MPRLGGNYSAGGVHVPTECLRNTPIPPHARCKYHFWSLNFHGITVHCISCYTLQCIENSKIVRYMAETKIMQNFMNVFITLVFHFLPLLKSCKATDKIKFSHDILISINYISRF